MTVTLFVADGCPHCARLIGDLARRRVDHRIVNLSRWPERLEELSALTRERRVPVVVDHELISVGFEGGSTELVALGLERLAILSAEGGEANR